MICKNCMIEMQKAETLCSKCGAPLHNDCINKCIKCGAVLCDMCSLENKFVCDNCREDEKIDLKYIRRSHIELYKHCPYAFYLEVIKKVPTKNNVYAENGIILHDIINTYSEHLEDEFHSPEWMMNEYTRMYADLNGHKDFKLKPELQQKLYNDGILSLKNYVLFEQEYNNAPIATEKQMCFILDEELPKVRVTVDRINRVANGLEILDYKSGKVYAGQKLVNDLQISTYIMTTEEEFKEPVSSFRFLFLREAKERLYTRQNDNEFLCKVGKNDYVVNLQDHIKEIKVIFARIMQGKFDIPHNTQEYYCKNMCYYGKEGICAGGEVERWNLNR